MKLPLRVLAVGVLMFSGSLGICQENDPFADTPPTPSPPATPQGVDPFAEGKPKSEGVDPFVSEETPAKPSAATKAYQDNMSLFTEWIQVDPVVLSGMIAGGDVPLGDGDAVRAEVDKFIKRGAAKLLDSCVVTGRDGKAKVEGVLEHLYAVEWDPGESTGPGDRIVQPRVVDGVSYWPPCTYTHPTTFEMRQVGTTVEREATMLPSGSAYVMALTPEMVRRESQDSEYGNVSLSATRVAATSLPVFGTSRTASKDLSEAFGRTLWLGTTPYAEGKPVLIFTRLDRVERLQKPKLPKQTNVTAVIEFLEVGTDWFQEVMLGSRGQPVDGSVLRGKLQEALVEGSASIFDVSTVTGPVGQQMQTEGIVERIYPSEYDPAELPPPFEEGAETEGFWPLGAYPTPTAFQTRNTGTAARVTVNSTSLGQGYDVSVVSELVRHLADVPSHELITPHGKEPLCTMPLFATSRVTTNVFLHPGEVVLLGAMSPKSGDDLDRRIMMFLRLAK